MLWKKKLRLFGPHASRPKLYLKTGPRRPAALKSLRAKPPLPPTKASHTAKPPEFTNARILTVAYNGMSRDDGAFVRSYYAERAEGD